VELKKKCDTWCSYLLIAQGQLNFETLVSSSQ
jgi:hypothetical protein